MAGRNVRIEDIREDVTYNLTIDPVTGDYVVGAGDAPQLFAVEGERFSPERMEAIIDDAIGDVQAGKSTRFGYRP